MSGVRKGRSSKHNPLPRVLLCEFITQPVLYHRSAELFPFLSARIKSLGGQVRWICLGLETNVLADSDWEFRLPDLDLDTLRQAIAEFQPTRMLLNQGLADQQMSLLLEASGGVSPEVAGIEPEYDMGFIHEVDNWAGFEAGHDPLEPSYLLDSVMPDHACEAGNELAVRLQPPVIVLAGPNCYYVAPIMRNPWFQGVDLSQATRQGGCTFCRMPGRPPRYQYRTPAHELALRQIRAARGTSPGFRVNRDFVVNGAAAFFQLRRLFETLIKDGDPPTRLHFRCRIDEFLRKKEEIELLLPRLQDAGHSLGLLSMGLENYSPDENSRFNKGILPEQIEKALELMLEWPRSFPGTFLQEPVGAHSHITFTPWTTLSDLKVNLEFALRYKPEFAIRSFLNARVFLFPGLPLALLAGKDGLIADCFEDPAFEHVEKGCITTPDQYEIPWRFRNGDVRAVYSLMVRLWDNAALSDDDLYRLVRRVAVRIGESRESMFRFALLMVEEAESLARSGHEPGPREILDAAIVRAEAAGILGEQSNRDEPAAGNRTQTAITTTGTRFLTDFSTMLRLVQLHQPGLLRGFEPRVPELHEGPTGAEGDWGSIHVTLERDSDRLDLMFFDGSSRQHLASFGPFGVAHSAETPLDTPDRQAVAIQLLKAFVRFTAGPLRKKTLTRAT